MMLEVKGLDAGYGDVQVLRGVDMKVAEGEIVSIVGANCAGKTTLIRTVMGTLPAFAGEVRFCGERISGRPSHQIARLGIAQVMEGRRLFGHMEVEDNLRVGGDLLRDARRSRDNLEWIYSLFPRLRERRRQLARSFSGGEQQMLAIGRALMSQPKLLLLDEPSLGLAPLMVEHIFGVVRELKRQGVTMLLVEQNVHHALDVADRAYVIETGRVVLDGLASELKHNAQVEQSYLGR